MCEQTQPAEDQDETEPAEQVVVEQEPAKRPRRRGIQLLTAGNARIPRSTGVRRYPRRWS
jgi:hypothetical protein